MKIEMLKRKLFLTILFAALSLGTLLSAVSGVPEAFAQTSNGNGNGNGNTGSGNGNGNGNNNEGGAGDGNGEDASTTSDATRGDRAAIPLDRPRGGRSDDSEQYPGQFRSVQCTTNWENGACLDYGQ